MSTQKLFFYTSILSVLLLLILISCSEDMTPEYPRKYIFTQNHLGTSSFYTIENDAIKSIEPEGLLLKAHEELLDAEQNSTPIFFFESFELLNESQIVMKQFDIWGEPAEIVDTVDYILEDDAIIVYEDTLELHQSYIFYNEDLDRIEIPFLVEYIRKYNGGGGASFDTTIEDPGTVLTNGLGTQYENGDSIYFNTVDFIYERE